MAQSRLQNSLKRKAIHNILLAIFGFIIVVILVIVFGAKLLEGFSLLIEKFQGNDTTQSEAQQNDSYIAPPTLNPATDATNSAHVTLAGFAAKNQTVSLYVNGELIDKTSVDDSNHFQFSSVSLQPGQNTIKTKAATVNKESDYSNSITISYVKDPPKLSIDKPQDGQGFDKGSSATVRIEGQATQGAKVTVNGSWAIVDDQGRYNYLYTLKDGDNDIKVVATDDAGNQTTREIHIHTQ